MTSQALVPTLLKDHDQLSIHIFACFAGSMLLALLAQVSIHLPFTPVPITGQTFGVALLALCWGSQRAVGSFAFYLFEGAIGLPVFASGKSGLFLGPTTGYLVGMLITCAVVGFLADRGLAKNMLTAFVCCLIGSSITLICGLIGLSYFISGRDTLLATGLWPFLPGDLIKNLGAALIASTLTQRALRD